MKSFGYEGIDSQKKSHRGVIQAISGEDAIIELMQRGIVPSRIDELSSVDLGVANRLQRFKQLREVLGGPEADRLPPVMQAETKVPTLAIDWSYVLFLVVAAGVVAAYFLVSH